MASKPGKKSRGGKGTPPARPGIPDNEAAEQSREKTEAREALNRGIPTRRERMVEIGRGNQQSGRG
jgi:hypothetical protein